MAKRTSSNTGKRIRKSSIRKVNKDQNDVPRKNQSVARRDSVQLPLRHRRVDSAEDTNEQEDEDKDRGGRLKLVAPRTKDESVSMSKPERRGIVLCGHWFRMTNQLQKATERLRQGTFLRVHVCCYTYLSML